MSLRGDIFDKAPQSIEYKILEDKMFDISLFFIYYNQFFWHFIIFEHTLFFLSKLKDTIHLSIHR